MILARAWPMKSCVVDIKSAFEARRNALRIKRQPAYERGGSISISVEDVRQKRESLGERIPHVLHVIELRIGSGEDGGVRGSSQGNLGVGTRKDHRVSRQCIQTRRKPTLGSEEAHAISAGGVECDQHYVRT